MLASPRCPDGPRPVTGAGTPVRAGILDGVWDARTARVPHPPKREYRPREQPVVSPRTTAAAHRPGARRGQCGQQRACAVARGGAGGARGAGGGVRAVRRRPAPGLRGRRRPPHPRRPQQRPRGAGLVARGVRRRGPGARARAARRYARRSRPRWAADPARRHLAHAGVRRGSPRPAAAAAGETRGQGCFGGAGALLGPGAEGAPERGAGRPLRAHRVPRTTGRFAPGPGRRGGAAEQDAGRTGRGGPAPARGGRFPGAAPGVRHPPRRRAAVGPGRDAAAPGGSRGRGPSGAGSRRGSGRRNCPYASSAGGRMPPS